jgi:hypothetical protein
MTRIKVRKLLITSGSYEASISREVNRLHQQGKSIAEIQKATGLKRASIHSYLPYSKAIYKLEDTTVTAERVRKYRSRKQSVEGLKEVIETGNQATAEAALCDTFMLFQEYPFRTRKNLLPSQ